MGYSCSSASGRIGYGNSNARGNYGYSRGLSGRVSYSLAMPKAYGTELSMDSYLVRGKKGIEGYAENLNKYSMGNVKPGYSYPLPRKQEPYKILEMMKNYDFKMIKTLGVMGLNVSVYDLPSMRRPISNIESRLNLN